MTMDAVTAATLSDEARRQLARAKVAGLKATLQAALDAGQRARPAWLAADALLGAMSQAASDAQNALTVAQADLASLEATSKGVAADFGPYSTTDQALQRERDAGKAALIDFVKLNPTCTEAQAIAQWKVVALAGRPADRQWLLHDPAALRQEYSANLVAMKYVADATWATFAAFIAATAKDALIAI